MGRFDVDLYDTKYAAELNALDLGRDVYWIKKYKYKGEAKEKVISCRNVSAIYVDGHNEAPYVRLYENNTYETYELPLDTELMLGKIKETV